MSGTLFPTRRVASGAQLTVERQGIRFWNVATDRVHIAIEVRNEGTARSRPTTARLRGAPLGAFVDWTPLAAVRVPAIEPGSSMVVETEARSPVTRPVADLSGRLPKDRPWPTARLLEAKGLLKLLQPPAEPGVLPGDLMGLLSLRGFHWAGNIDVHVGDTAVERHQACTRLHPGRVNMTYFTLGGGAQAYTLRLEGEAAGWENALYDVAHNRRYDAADGVFTLEDVGTNRLLAYACKPPLELEHTKFGIQVERQPGGGQAVVEFDLDAVATGPGSFLG